jgi:hypothetical protein
MIFQLLPLFMRGIFGFQQGAESARSSATGRFRNAVGSQKDKHKLGSN